MADPARLSFWRNEFEGDAVLRREAPRFHGEARTEGEAREEAGRVWVGSRWAPPRKFLKIITWNGAIWCVVDAKFQGYEQSGFLKFEEHHSCKNWS